MITERVETCTPKVLFVVIEGDDVEEFRRYVEKYLATHPAQLAHGDTMKDILTKRGDKYIAVLQQTPLNSVYS